jgi:hypothetical protein
MNYSRILKIAVDMAVKHFDNPSAAALFMGISLQGLDEESLKKAYRAKALELHPDRNPHEDTTSEFKTLQNAYELLSHHLSGPAPLFEWGDEDDDYEDEYEDPEREAEFEEFDEKFRPKLEKMPIMEYWYWAMTVDPKTEPMHWYQFDRVDRASDEDLITSMLKMDSIKEADQSRDPNMNIHNSGRSKGLYRMIEREVVFRLSADSFDKSLVSRLSSDQRHSLSEKWARHEEEKAQMEEEERYEQSYT